MSKSLELTCFSRFLIITAVPSYGRNRADRTTAQLVNGQQYQNIFRVGQYTNSY